MLTINVTKGNIHRGKMGSMTSCPTALAIKKLFPEQDIIVTGFGVQVGPLYIDQYKTIPRKHFNLSKRMMKFIERFDDGKEVSPTIFKLAEKIDRIW